MCKIMLTEQEQKELKSYCWEKNFDDTFSIGGISIEKFSEFTGYDLAKLNDLKSQEISMGWNLVYGRPGTCDTYPTSYYLHWVVYIDNKIWLNGSYFINDVDFLELYTPTEEPKEEPTEEKNEADWHDLLTDALKIALEETDTDSIVEFIDNNFADVSNKIRENLCENLEVDDIGEILKEDIAKEWIENNPDDAWDIAENNMCSGDVRDKIISYLENNL